MPQLKFTTGLKIFLSLLALGFVAFFLLYNNGAEGFACDGEMLIIGSVLALIYSLVDNVFYKDINTNELLKQSPIAYAIHLLGYPFCFYIATILVKRIS
jgi:hypothetical protein